jgi:hypothetical protein
MPWKAIVVAAAMALIGGARADAQLCSVCMASGGDAAEETELIDSLTAIGFDLVITSDPAAESCEVAVTHAGYGGFADVSAWVALGHGLVQISDWGPDLQPNTWAAVADGEPQTAEVVDSAHPITELVAASWDTLGFWAYQPGADYVGWVTDPDPNLVRVGGRDRALSARAEGAGRVVYVGWNVYGSLATADDLTILGEAISWAGRCAVPVTLQSFTVE